MSRKKQPIREKKHRLPREYYRGELLVAITARIVDHRPAFVTAKIVESCVRILEEAASAQHCAVLIYCFMPDHLHLMIEGLRPTSDTWRAMVLFKQRTGFSFSKNKRGFRWQNNFYDHITRSDEDWRAQVRYIANNPVRGGLVEQWDEYPFMGSIGYDLYAIIEGAAQIKIR